MKLGMQVNNTIFQHLPKFGGISTKQVKWEIIMESEEIIVKSIVLQLPHLLYCDLPPPQNLSMKLGMHVNNTMIQHYPNFVTWAWKQVELGIIFESEEIIIKRTGSFLTCQTVIHLLARICQWNLACTLTTLWSNIHPNSVVWAWKQIELEIMFESGDIMYAWFSIHGDKRHRSKISLV